MRKTFGERYQEMMQEVYEKRYQELFDNITNNIVLLLQAYGKERLPCVDWELKTNGNLVITIRSGSKVTCYDPKELFNLEITRLTPEEIEKHLERERKKVLQEIEDGREIINNETPPTQWALRDDVKRA